jgi:Ser/Thr protein kinase RdoA (MazF antagonist)
MNSVWDQETKYFYALTPEVIDRSLEFLGFRPSGRTFALNSLENRVYEVEVRNHPLLTPPFSPDCVIVKFYRPGRWSREAIGEEHQFLWELKGHGIPVIAPLEIDGETLRECPTTGFFYTLFPKMRGRLKDELLPEEIEQIGRLTGRIHNVGASGEFHHRPVFHPKNYIDVHFEHLKSVDYLPATIVSHYLQLAAQLSSMITPYLDQLKFQRIHGDLHRGNIIWNAEGPWIVDFDDCAWGPREQDLWPLLPGRDEYSRKDQELFAKAYHSMAKEEVNLTEFMVESLRAMRIIHFNGWISKRWQDPSFKHSFSAFESESYWENQLLDLKEQIGYLQDALYNP